MLPGAAITPSYGLLIRLRPTTPWRFGPDSGARDRVDPVCHSDTLYSAVCSAMASLGLLEEWLRATAASQGQAAVCLGSCFPSVDDTLLAPPPASVWPPPPSAKVRWDAARFVPIPVIESILFNQPLREDSWWLDGESQCLLSTGRGKTSPFRIRLR